MEGIQLKDVEMPRLDEPEVAAWKSWLRTAKLVTGAIEHDLRQASGLTLDDFEVMVCLSEAPDQRMRLSALGQKVANSPSRISQRVDRLIRKGLVVRERCEEDRRGYWAILTSEGSTVLKAASPDHIQAVRRHFIDQMTEDEVLVVASLFGRLSDQLGR